MSNRSNLTGSLILGSFDSDPIDAQNGEMYYNTTDGMVKMYVAGSWTPIPTSGGGADVAKRSVELATGPGQDLDLDGAEVIDGETPADGDRILAKDQANPIQNGIYIYNGSGPWTRSTDFASGSNQIPGCLIYVARGNSQTGQGERMYVLRSETPQIDLVIDTDALQFREISGADSRLSNLHGGATLVGVDFNPATDGNRSAGIPSARWGQMVSTDFSVSDGSNTTMQLRQTVENPDGSGNSPALTGNNIPVNVFSQSYGGPGPDNTPTLNLLTGRISSPSASGDTGDFNFGSGSNAGSGLQGKSNFFGQYLNMNSKQIKAAADPTAPQDLATKAYVDALIQGIVWKAAADLATTANISLTGEQTIDGVLTSSSRVLVKNQSSDVDNGIYISNSGAWTRSSDADTGAKLQSAAVFVNRGTVNADKAWVQTGDSITIGVDPITWVQFTGVSSGANTALSNLATTNINASLLFDTDAAYEIGSGTKKPNITHTKNARLYDTGSIQWRTGGNIYGILIGSGSVSLPSGVSAYMTMQNLRDTGSVLEEKSIGIATSNTSGAVDSGFIYNQTGNAPGGVSGDIINRIGTGSTRGKYRIQDGSEGTIGHVFTSTDTSGGGAWAAPSSVSGANPTATIGLTAVNGVATTYLRSDGAPALSQAIAPTWSADHQWTNPKSTTTFPMLLNSSDPSLGWLNTSAGTNGKRWAWEFSTANDFGLSLINDAGTTRNIIMQITRSNTGATLNEMRIGATNSPIIGLEGRIQLKKGTIAYNSGSAYVVVGGVTFSGNSAVSNTAATETDAFSHTVAANTLGSSAMKLEFSAAGTFAATASTDKQVKVVFGATTILDTGALATTGGESWSIRGTIMRGTSATDVRCIVEFKSSFATTPQVIKYTTASDALGSNQTLKLTLNGTNAADTVAQFFEEKWFPQG